MGDAPLDQAQLRHLLVADPDFRAVPTQPVTMGFFRWVLLPEFGIDFARVVHGEERLTLLGMIPTEGLVRAKLRGGHHRQGRGARRDRLDPARDPCGW